MLGDIRGFDEQFHLEAVAHAFRIIEWIGQAFSGEDDRVATANHTVGLAGRRPARAAGKGRAYQVGQDIPLDRANSAPMTIQARCAGFPDGQIGGFSLGQVAKLVGLRRRLVFLGFRGFR
ncbi:hypothetical protein D3C76_1061460 [compost metagenome]